MSRSPKCSRCLFGAALVLAGLSLASCGDSSVNAQAPPGAPKARDRTSSPVVNGRRLPPARVGLSEVRNRNERNEPIELDETASLACANAQFAWVALLQNDPQRARDEVGDAVARAEESAVAEIKAGGGALRRASKAADFRTPIETFLSLCESRGYIM